MPVRTAMVKVGVWDVPNVGTRYRYRVCTVGGRIWTIYRLKKLPVYNNPDDTSPDALPWEFMETGFKSKASAVEYVEKLATHETVDPVKNSLFNHVADLLNNIDDGVDLNEGGLN